MSHFQCNQWRSIRRHYVPRSAEQKQKYSLPIFSNIYFLSHPLDQLLVRHLCFPSQCPYLCQTCFSLQNSAFVPVHFMCSMAARCAHIINQQMHNYKYSHVIILHQHVSVTSVTIIGISYNSNTINI